MRSHLFWKMTLQKIRCDLFSKMTTWKMSCHIFTDENPENTLSSVIKDDTTINTFCLIFFQLKKINTWITWFHLSQINRYIDWEYVSLKNIRYCIAFWNCKFENGLFRPFEVILAWYWENVTYYRLNHMNKRKRLFISVWPCRNRSS